MAESEVFDFVCEQLEQCTTLDRLEARGTVRITLKDAGLEARSVSVPQMTVVLEKLLPAELESRGVTDGTGSCQAIAAGLLSLDIDVDAAGDTPEGVFERLGG
jgi:hypothetical protein